MTRCLTLIIAALFPVLLLAQDDFGTLLKELDNTVDNYQVYSNRKENEINKLKDLLAHSSTDLHKYDISQKLFDEYKLYQSDSALAYARKNLRIATILRDVTKINSAKLNLASI